MTKDASGRDTAHERIADILRTAIPSSDDAPIEDETRRLMLHLSLERPQSPVLSEPPPARAGLLRQMLKRAGKKAR